MFDYIIRNGDNSGKSTIDADMFSLSFAPAVWVNEVKGFVSRVPFINSQRRVARIWRRRWSGAQQAFIVTGVMAAENEIKLGTSKF